MYRDSTVLRKDKSQSGRIAQPFQYGLWNVADVRSSLDAGRHGHGESGRILCPSCHVVCIELIVFNWSETALFRQIYIPLVCMDGEDGTTTRRHRGGRRTIAATPGHMRKAVRQGGRSTRRPLCCRMPSFRAPRVSCATARRPSLARVCANTWPPSRFGLASSGPPCTRERRQSSKDASVKCHYGCKNAHIVKDGPRRTKRKGKVQKYLCRKCNRRLSGLRKLKGHHAPTGVMADGLSLASKGMFPVRRIRGARFLDKYGIFLKIAELHMIQQYSI